MVDLRNWKRGQWNCGWEVDNSVLVMDDEMLNFVSELFAIGISDLKMSILDWFQIYSIF